MRSSEHTNRSSSRPAWPPPRGSQTPAEASAEAVIDKLEEVRNDARTQHSSSTTDVMNFQVVGESASQAVTEARIIGVRLISLINQGDSVLVKMAFRVRTELEETKKEMEPPSETPRVAEEKRPLKEKEKGFLGGLFGPSSSDELRQKGSDREPAPNRRRKLRRRNPGLPKKRDHFRNPQRPWRRPGEAPKRSRLPKRMIFSLN